MTRRSAATARRLQGPRMRTATVATPARSASARSRVPGWAAISARQPCAAIQARAVELADRLLGFLVRRHLDEAEAAGAARVAVRDDARGLHVAARGERFPQPVRGCGEREASDEEFHSHGARSYVAFRTVHAIPGLGREPGRGLSPRAGVHGEPATAPDG